MNTAEILEICARKAAQDEELRQKFLATKNAARPLESFCRICAELGYEIYPMDLISLGEDYYAAMRRSTNGGGENSPMLAGEDDYYELFLASLEGKQMLCPGEQDPETGRILYDLQ